MLLGIFTLFTLNVVEISRYCDIYNNFAPLKILFFYLIRFRKIVKLNFIHYREVGILVHKLITVV